MRGGASVSSARGLPDAPFARAKQSVASLLVIVGASPLIFASTRGITGFCWRRAIWLPAPLGKKKGANGGSRVYTKANLGSKNGNSG
jgi:hypothetical protein